MSKQPLAIPPGVSPPLATKACTCARLRQATRHITQRYDRALRPIGLRLTQYSLLVNIEKTDRPSITELAATLMMERTTLTRNLKPLEKQGLIAIAGGSDARSRNISITDAGRKLMTRAVPLWQAAEVSLRRALGDEQVAALHRLLDAVQALDI